MPSIVASPESEILTRLILPDQPDFTPDAARSILRMQFSENDRARMNELTAKEHTGAISDAEQQELNGFRFASVMLELLHAKANLSLERFANNE